MQLGIRLHLAGLSLSDTVSVLDRLGVERCRTTVHNWVQKANLQPLDGAKSDPVAVDETAIKINGEWSWFYAAIDLDTKLILDVELFGRQGTDPAAAFLHGLRQKHDLPDAVFLVDQFGYRTPSLA